MRTHDFIVIGGGIAGIAVAELLQRSGRAVLLIEEGEAFCTGSSAEQQGWFHTGALYAPMPEGRFFRGMVRNLDNLLKYYSGFAGMNIERGPHITLSRPQGWFSNVMNVYFYKAPALIKNPGERALWRLAISLARARLSWFEKLDFTQDIGRQIKLFMLDWSNQTIRANRPYAFDIGRVAARLQSRDRMMNSRQIAQDLLASYVRAGGEYRLSERVIGIRGEEVRTARGSYRAKHLVLTAGRHIASLIGASEKLKAVRLILAKSPLLVVRPALCDVNWVFMAPSEKENINHVFHEAPFGSYSIIGNVERVEEVSEKTRVTTQARMVRIAEKIFPQMRENVSCSLYFGNKSEFDAYDMSATTLKELLYRSLSNLPYVKKYLAHQHRARYMMPHIEPLSDNCVLALPGKFTLAFSLAVNVCRYYGIDPALQAAHLTPEIEVPIVPPPLHQQIAEALPRGSSLNARKDSVGSCVGSV